MPTRKTVRQSYVENQWKVVLQNIEKGRLRRGKTSAKQGEVSNVHVRNHWIVAQVKNMGFGGGTCQVELPCIDNWEPHLENVASWFAHRPDWLAACLAGEWDSEFLEFVEHAGLSLFPDEKFAERMKWEAKCTCRDFEPFCKHIVAVVYELIGVMESEPLQALVFVGLKQKTLLNSVHSFSRSLAEKSQWPLTTKTITEKDSTLSHQLHICPEEEIAFNEIQPTDFTRRHRLVPTYETEALAVQKERYMTWK